MMAVAAAATTMMVAAAAAAATMTMTVLTAKAMAKQRGWNACNEENHPPMGTIEQSRHGSVLFFFSFCNYTACT